MNNTERELGYHFSNKRLLSEALHHSSIKKYAIPFERLEFLGDRVLGLVISEHIYINYPGKEGAMAKMQAAFVCAETCYEIAKKIGVDKVIQTAGNHLKSNKTVLADAMEAILGAIFIDSDYDRVKAVIHSLWKYKFASYNDDAQDPKTTLQEICQRLSGDVPRYEVLDITGSAHEPVYTISVTALSLTAEASGHSRKEAEIAVAKKILEQIKAKHG